MKKSLQPTYLSLSEASHLLGVHNSTLRRWADTGAIPVYVTPGGHRRFALADIQGLVASKPPSGYALAHIWAKRALDQARRQLEHAEKPPVWLAPLGEDDRIAWRQQSLQLMSIVLRYVGAEDDDAALLEEARTIGANYAVNAQRFGLSLTIALEAALFFRDTLIDTAMNMPEQANLPQNDSAQMLRRINKVLNVVHLAVAAGYETNLKQSA